MSVDVELGVGGNGGRETAFDSSARWQPVRRRRRVEEADHGAAVDDPGPALQRERGEESAAAVRPEAGGGSERRGDGVQRAVLTRLRAILASAHVGGHSIIAAPAATRVTTSTYDILVSGPFARTMLTNFFFFGSLNGYVLLPLYVHQLGGNEASVGLVQGMFSAAGILCQPLIGAWIDRIGRHFFMVLGVTLLTLSCVAFVVTSSIPLLGALRALQGIGFSAFFVANYVHIVDLVPVERRGWALGIYGLSGFLGTALAPVAGEMVVNNLGFRWLFLLAVLLSSVAALLVARTYGIRPPDMGRGPGFEMFREALKDVLRVHMALAFFFGLGIGAMFTFLPTFGESLGVRSVALYYTAYAVAAMGVRVAGGNLIDTQGRRATIIPSMFIQAASVAILAILALQVRLHMAVPIVPFLVLAGLLAGGGHGFLYPALSALLMDVTPERHRGGAVGIFSGVMLIGQTLGSMIFGYVAHGFGYAVMWGVVTLLLTGGFVLSHRLREGRPTRVPVAG